MSTPNRTLRFQISKVWARNFRSIADASLDLDRITVLVGPNASGKSNVLDILRFVKDSLRFDLDAAISMRHGFDAIRRRTADGLSEEVEIGLTATIEGDPNQFTIPQSRLWIYPCARFKWRLQSQRGVR